MLDPTQFVLAPNGVIDSQCAGLQAMHFSSAEVGVVNKVIGLWLTIAGALADATSFHRMLEAALEAGCMRFDGAVKGFGGCPMAGNDLVGNMNTEIMIDYFHSQNRMGTINKEALALSLQKASSIFI